MKFVSIALLVSIAAGQSLGTAVKGAPFSADQMQTSPYRASPYVIGHFYRDSSGRTRSEAVLITGGWRIGIVDPISGVAYSLDVENKVAHRKASGVGDLGIPVDVVEELGDRTIKSGNGYSSWLANISRDEPDAALFRIPADYRVVVD